MTLGVRCFWIGHCYGVALTSGCLRFLVLALVMVLAACSTVKGLLGDKKKIPAATELQIKPAADADINLIVVASPLMNPDSSGVPTSLVARIYFLNSPSNFVKANFSQLWAHDVKTLGPTMLAKQELILKPSQARHFVAKLPNGTTIVAVTAGFENYQKAKWRAAFPLVGEPPYKLEIDLKSLSVNIATQG